MKARWTLPLVVLLLLMLVSPTLAQTGVSESSTESQFPTGSFLVQTVAMAVVFACVLTGFKFYSAIKGGRLSRGWLWIFFGLLVFAFGQLMLLGGRFGVIPVLSIWVDALRVISLSLFFVGINQLRKLLA